MSWRERLESVWGPARRWYDGHSERDRRIIAGVVIAVVLSFVYVGLLEPLSERRRRMERERQQGLVRIERAERLVSALDELQAERDDLRARVKVARRRLLPGGSSTLGAAALQERANDLASEHGVTVSTTQVLRSEPSEPYRKVAVRLTLSGDLSALAAMLAGLEYQHELTIPFLELSGRGRAAARNRAARAPQRNLSATVEVAGYVAGADEDEAEVGEELPGPPLPPEGGEGFIGPPAPPEVGAA